MPEGVAFHKHDQAQERQKSNRRQAGPEPLWNQGEEYGHRGRQAHADYGKDAPGHHKRRDASVQSGNLCNDLAAMTLPRSSPDLTAVVPFAKNAFPYPGDWRLTLTIPDPLPAFDQLPVADGAPPQSGWWLFGKDDQVGLFNLQTPERIAAAARLVTRGTMFPLNWEMELPTPPLYGRGAVRQTIFRNPNGHDDVLDNFFPQASSQWDSLVHVGHPQHGFYNGIVPEDVTGQPGTRGGIEHWARRGIAGRGVLLDVARFLEQAGRPIDAGERIAITVDDLEACRAAQGVEIHPGDVLIIRTGWIPWYLQQDAATRRAITVPANLRAPGLASGETMARYLWDLHVVAACSDCPALEAWPPLPESGGFLHWYLIGLFGMAIGELWYLEALAADCASDGRYEFFFTSAPLNKLGGVGSPPNAIAFK